MRAPARRLSIRFTLVLSAGALVSTTGCAPSAPEAGNEPGRAAAANAALPTLPPELSAVRTALDKYRDPYAALRDGYFSTVGCLEFPGGAAEGRMAYPAGAMGVHFLNPLNIGPTLDPMRPQVLLYEPTASGELVLTGAEWFAPVEVSPQAPTIFGRALEGPMEGHEPILPRALHHWDLHVWLWKDNPNGLFSPTNSSVRCPPGPYTIQEEPPVMLHGE